MYNVSTSGWLMNRNATQSVITQALPAVPTRDAARELFYLAIPRVGLLPSWAILLMIILATSGICASVVIRSRGAFRESSEQLLRMTSEIQALRQQNGNLQSDIRRLTNDSKAIELAARERLGMVRPNDVIVPIESIPSSSLGTLSFVR